MVAPRARLAHREGPVVAEALADRARVMGDPEPGLDVVLDRVAVLVPDDLHVLAVVDAALAEGHGVLRGVIEAVVPAELPDPDVLRLPVYRSRPGAPGVELAVGD